MKPRFDIKTRRVLIGRNRPICAVMAFGQPPSETWPFALLTIALFGDKCYDVMCWKCREPVTESTPGPVLELHKARDNPVKAMRLMADWHGKLQELGFVDITSRHWNAPIGQKMADAIARTAGFTPYERIIKWNGKKQNKEPTNRNTAIHEPRQRPITM